MDTRTTEVGRMEVVFRAIKVSPLLFAAYLVSPVVFGQEAIIEACRSLAEGALRTYTTYRDDRAFLAVSYSSHCGMQRSYEQLSSSQQASFDAAYKRILRLGYGSDKENSSTKDHYAAFCNNDASMFQVDQEIFNEVSTIRTDALKTVDLCLKSWEANITVNYSTPSEPEDFLTVTFQARIGSQLIYGAGTRNMKCNHGDTLLQPELTEAIEVSSNAVNITCRRRSEPITIYGLDGRRYPRAQVAFYTNYADTALDIVLPEGVTGPLQERLSKIEEGLTKDTVPRGAYLLMPGACPERVYEDVTKTVEGRYLKFDANANGVSTEGGGDGSHAHTGGGHKHGIDLQTSKLGKGEHRGSRDDRAAPNQETKLNVKGNSGTVTHSHDGGVHEHAFAGFRLCRKK